MSRDRQLRDRAGQLIWPCVAGILGGGAVLLADSVLAGLTLGYPVPVRPLHLFWYAAAGAVTALGIAGLRRLLSGRIEGRSRTPSRLDLVVFVVVALYAPAIAERVGTFLEARAGGVLAVAGGVGAVAAYGVWLAAIARCSGSARGLLFGAAAVAFGLAWNRNVVDSPTEPLALLVGTGLVGGALALAMATRRLENRRVVGGVAAALLAIILAIVLAIIAWRLAFLGSRVPDPRVAASASAAAARGGSSPSLFLVVVDTLRADVFDAVVEETSEGRAFQEALGPAVWFSNTIAAAPWTAPAMGSMFTGLYPQEHGFARPQEGASGRALHRLDPSLTTLAEHLRARGYRTSALVTNPFLHRESGVLQGFERIEILRDGTAKLPLLTAFRQLGWIAAELYQDAGEVRRRCARELRALAGSDRPFFLWVHLMDPHRPLRAHRSLGPDPRAAELDDEDRRYREEVRYALLETARMFELARGRGLWEDTAVVVVADHGEMLASDGRFRGEDPEDPGFRRQGHGHALYRELMRVPMVIRPARSVLDADRRVVVLNGHVDLVHTVADHLGVERMAVAGDRFSVEPWLRKELPSTGSGTPPGRELILLGATHASTPRQRGVRAGGSKLIRYPDGERDDELYDLGQDPSERRNLASVEPARLAWLRELLASSWESLAPAPAAEPAELDAETRRRLKALGYL